MTDESQTVEELRRSVELEPVVAQAKAEVYDWLIAQLRGGVNPKDLLDDALGRRHHLEEVMVQTQAGRAP